MTRKQREITVSANKMSTREKKNNNRGSDLDVAEIVGLVPLNSMELRGLMLADDLTPSVFSAASLKFRLLPRG